MITINGIDIVPKYFPDGTYRLLNFPIDNIDNTWVFQIDKNIIFDWNFESEEETMLLWYLIHHCKEHYSKDINYILSIKYLPGARMDRVKTSYEVFTLKYFVKLINLMNFDSVTLLDPHSDVSVALFNNCSIISSELLIKRVISRISEEKKEVILYYPDAGCVKRLKDMFSGLYLYGEKNRDWKTGDILGLELKGPVNEVWSIENKSILMIDDICSYGGTFYHSAKELKKAFPDTKIYSYSTHTENEFPTLQKAFDEELIEMHFTTDSIYRQTNDKIQVIKC